MFCYSCSLALSLTDSLSFLCSTCSLEKESVRLPAFLRPQLCFLFSIRCPAFTISSFPCGDGDDCVAFVLCWSPFFASLACSESPRRRCRYTDAEAEADKSASKSLSITRHCVVNAMSVLALRYQSVIPAPSAEVREAFGSGRMRHWLAL
ncbi:hypothetical protein TRVL_07099 [Trypanosoma vivax]|nr:hypothetical protein TRVL_07099 [Trypanosoma vivax]